MRRTSAAGRRPRCWPPRAWPRPGRRRRSRRARWRSSLAELVGARALDDAVALAALPLVDDERRRAGRRPRRPGAAGRGRSAAAGRRRAVARAARRPARRAALAGRARRSPRGARGRAPTPGAASCAPRSRCCAPRGDARRLAAPARRPAAGASSRRSTWPSCAPTLDLLPDVVLAAPPARAAGGRAHRRRPHGRAAPRRAVERLLRRCRRPTGPRAPRGRGASTRCSWPAAATTAVAERVARGGPGRLRRRGARDPRARAAGPRQALAFRNEPDAMAEAEQRLREAAAALRRRRRGAWRAAALASLGYRVLFARGDLDRAAEVLEAAAAGTPRGPRARRPRRLPGRGATCTSGRLDAAEAAARESLGAGPRAGRPPAGRLRLLDAGRRGVAARRPAATLEALKPSTPTAATGTTIRPASSSWPTPRPCWPASATRPPAATRTVPGAGRGGRLPGDRVVRAGLRGGPRAATRRGPSSCSSPTPARRSSRRATPGARCWCAPTPPAGADDPAADELEARARPRP